VKLHPPALKQHFPERNYFRFRLGPELSINVGARIKTTGRGLATNPVELSVVHRPHNDEVDAYERLITDAMDGYTNLFVRDDAVQAAWEIVEPTLGTVGPALVYEPGTWGPPEADRLAADIGGWYNPKAAE
jgi:glucose-6-phosphate 1-dehydrogenase